jgi:hypothetical protein
LGEQELRRQLLCGSNGTLSSTEFHLNTSKYFIDHPNFMRKIVQNVKLNEFGVFLLSFHGNFGFVGELKDKVVGVKF